MRPAFRRIAAAAPAASIAICLAACATTGPTPPRPAYINHVVFVKLHDPSRVQELLDDSDAMLATIPGMVSYYSGAHLDTGRPTVTADYDAGLFMGFDSQDAYARYVDHPAHVAFVDKWRLHLAWLRVYDVADRGR